MEFLIRRADHGDWNDKALDPDVCRPTSVPSRLFSDPHAEPRFEVSGTEFQFIYEMPGIQVIVQGETLDRPQVTNLLQEVVDRMGAATGTPGYLIDIDSYGGAPIAFAGPGEPGSGYAADGTSGTPFCRGRELLIHCAFAGVTLGLAFARVWIGAALAATVWIAWGVTVVRVRGRVRRRRA